MSSDEFVVTPWHVEGDIDYDKLIKQFGTQKISNDLLLKLQKITGEDHFMLRRGVFFSHRDLNLILENHQKGKDFFTGCLINRGYGRARNESLITKKTP